MFFESCGAGVPRNHDVVVMQGLKGVEYLPDFGFFNITGGCEAVADLPDLTFVFDRKPYAIPNYLWTQKVGNLNLEPFEGDVLLGSQNKPFHSWPISSPRVAGPRL
jgi:hypothetical protein